MIGISIVINIKDMHSSIKNQPSGNGGTRSPPATPHHVIHQKWPPEGPKMAGRLFGAPFNFR